jgi:hypothetical protein
MLFIIYFTTHQVLFIYNDRYWAQFLKLNSTNKIILKLSEFRKIFPISMLIAKNGEKFG